MFTPVARPMASLLGPVRDFSTFGQDEASVPVSMAYRKMLLKKMMHDLIEKVEKLEKKQRLMKEKNKELKHKFNKYEVMLKKCEERVCVRAASCL